MSSGFSISRVWVAYLVTIPLALLVGYSLATPLAIQSFLLIAATMVFLAFPLAIKFHHIALIAVWNASLVVFFLPGQPILWTFLSCVSLGMALLNRSLRREKMYIPPKSLSFPLLILVAVVVATSLLTGGFGGRAFGSDTWGAKRYLGVIGGVIGFFALCAGTVPQHLRTLVTGIFFLGGTTAIISDFIYYAGPSFYILYAIFPTDVAMMAANSSDVLKRSTGIAWAAQSSYWFFLMIWGWRGILNPRKPWRLAIVGGLFVLGLFGGYRSSIVLFIILAGCQFYFERLHRTKLLFIFIGISLLMGTIILGFGRNMPLSIQRSLSFLPIDLHPIAKQDAKGTMDWRLDMWRVVVKDVPKYLWIGKGYAFSGTDFVLTQEAVRRGHFQGYEDTLVTGNYHNGILTLLIPFGLFGFGAFLWFCGAGFWALRRNYLYGDSHLSNINTFLISYYSARLIFYFVFYGQFDLDLMVFTGVVGLSIAINGGIKSPPLPAIARDAPNAAEQTPETVPA